MSKHTAVIYRAYDPVELELVEAQLRAADVPYVRVGRGNAAMLGVGNYIVEQLIEVPLDYEEQARDLLRAYADAADPDEDGGLASSEDASEDGAEPTGSVSTKSRMMALGASLLFPGLGISYVGLPLTGLTVAIWAFATLMLSPTARDPVPLAIFGHIVPRVVEVVGTQVWLTRYGRKGPSAMAQLAIALLAVGCFYAGQRYAGPSVSLWLTDLAAGLEPAN